MYTLKIAQSSLIIIVFILSINSCTKQQNNILNSDDENNICIYLDGNELKYNSDTPIAGFQFNHLGCVTGASGGDAESQGFTISTSGSAVLGFSFTGATIPSGSGTLITLEGEVTQECMSNFVFSDSDGGALDIDISDSPCATLSLMTWNLENFPKSGLETINHVSTTINEYQPDIIALQEMPTDINHEGISLLEEALPDYNFILGTNSFASLAFLYRENSLIEYIDYFNMLESINISEFKDIDIDYILLRNPLTLHIKWHDNDLYIINNHFKCCGDGLIQMELLFECDEDEERYFSFDSCAANCNSGDCFDTFDEEYRRLLASQFFQQYTDTDQNVIILGDLNDELTDHDSTNVFLDLLEDENFIFADMNIAEGHHDYWSYPGYPSHIDHILLTTPLENSFNNLHSSIKVLPVDLNFMNWDQYDFLVSDHRPVLLKLAY